MQRYTCCLLLVLSVGVITVESARILGIFPHPSHSHQVVFRSLTMELLKRGHELIVFTPDLVNDPTLKNYTEVSLSSFYDIMRVQINFLDKRKGGYFPILNDITSLCGIFCDKIFSHPTMKQMLSPDSGQKFDVLLIQQLCYDSLLALSIRFDAPVIGVSSLPIITNHREMLGSPHFSAYSPDTFVPFSDEMTLLERMWNLYYRLRQIYIIQFYNIPLQNEVLQKHFGPNVPPVSVLWKNLSLILVDTHPFLMYPQPIVPSIIPIGGSRLFASREKKPLPKDIQKVLNNSKQGFIYFSLGTNINVTELPKETIDNLLWVFRELPYTVLCKLETDKLAGMPDNVFIRKWLPQQQVLAHTNIKLFFYQGGLQSTQEAVANGVPVIGYSVYADQHHNVNKLVVEGMGMSIDLETVERDGLKQAIMEVTTNPRYKENAMRLRNLFYDLPYHPMDNAMWWIEHVIRHKGARHLYNKSRNMSWYQIELLDILAIVLVVLLLLLYVAYCIFRFILRKIRRYCCRKKEILKRD